MSAVDAIESAIPEIHVSWGPQRGQTRAGLPGVPQTLLRPWRFAS